jgi:hypothetical protein
VNRICVLVLLLWIAFAGTPVFVHAQQISPNPNTSTITLNTTASNQLNPFTNSGTIDITDTGLLSNSGTLNNSGTVTMTNFLINYGTLIDSGTVNINDNYGYLINYGTFDINGGTVNINGFGYFLNSNGTVNINGGTVNINGSGYLNNSGVLNINSGTVNLNSVDGFLYCEDNTLNYNSGTNTMSLGGLSWYIETLILGQGANLNITDGTLNIGTLIDPTGSNSGITGNFTVNTYGTLNAVPIPGAIMLLAPGLIGLARIRRRFKAVR